MCSAPITGRGGKLSIISVVEGAALIACALLRQNKTATLIGFDSEQYPSHDIYSTRLIPGVYSMDHLNPFDSIMTNVAKVNQNGGGTDCSLPFKWLNQAGRNFQNIVVLSDYESWSGSHRYSRGCAATAEWKRYSQRHITQLACVDLQPQNTTQVPDQPGHVINVGGWNDQMFRVLERFFNQDKRVIFTDIISEVELRPDGVSREG